jgi:hypothetical protein
MRAVWKIALCGNGVYRTPIAVISYSKCINFAIRAEAAKRGETELMSLWCGTGVARAAHAGGETGGDFAGGDQRT